MANSLSLTTLRELARMLQGMPTTEHTLLRFSYQQPGREALHPMTVLLEKLAESACLSSCQAGTIALHENDVLCLCVACPPRAALQFARLVRARLRASASDALAGGSTLSVGIVPIRGGCQSASALIQRTASACAAARRKGNGRIELFDHLPLPAGLPTES